MIFSRRTEKNNDKLEDLKAQKRKILEEVMETETYKNAKMILERFDPESKKKIELESTPAGPHMTPKPGQAPGGPPERSLSAIAAQQSLMRKPVTLGTPVPGVVAQGSMVCVVSKGGICYIVVVTGMHPPGPPLARPVLPRERGAVDRVIEYLVGDGPQNRYALICQQCLSHNGMALKEEFEYVAFRCAYCYFLNPARKTRPQAPRLLEVTGEPRMSSEAPSPAPPPGSDAEDDRSASGDNGTHQWHLCNDDTRNEMLSVLRNPTLLMSLLKWTPRSRAHQQPQSPVLLQTAKAPQSHKICPLRNLTETKMCLPWRWNKTVEQ
ncbi:hypothetical protein L3Q82_017490 [Scortum barcoo]|uniref:Uncharacterized protein n=1 Tax=Scortum barcoo TaxID=214431 RepID=A0ACB8VKP0_9TELE|nr:hypothetical protein L3Q82_017490 [Scortum barcoo]